MMIFSVFFSLLAFQLWPAEARSSGQAGEVSFSIRFFDKRIYYVEKDPIYVQITIANNSPLPFRFKLADDRAFSVDFGVKTMSNRSLEPAETLIRKRTSSAQVFFREIAVESGESFSFVEDLRDYADLRNSGSFIVQARVYPELFRENAVPLESNRLSLNIRPPAIPGPQGISLAMDEETGAKLTREKIAPDEVVSYFLTALQKSQWEKYFLYLDVEALISSDPVRRRQWLAEGEEGRRAMAEKYRSDVKNAGAGSDMAAIPSEFSIERTEYNTLSGTVTVLEKFRVSNYTERKRYVYDLRRKDDIWTIINYSVMNLGTE
jgi:hypothetical protein